MALPRYSAEAHLKLACPQLLARRKSHCGFSAYDLRIHQLDYHSPFTDRPLRLELMLEDF